MDFNAIIVSLKSKKISNIVAGFYIYRDRERSDTKA